MYSISKFFLSILMNLFLFFKPVSKVQEVWVYYNPRANAKVGVIYCYNMYIILFSNYLSAQKEGQCMVSERNSATCRQPFTFISQ